MKIKRPDSTFAGISGRLRTIVLQLRLESAAGGKSFRAAFAHYGHWRRLFFQNHSTARKPPRLFAGWKELLRQFMPPDIEKYRKHVDHFDLTEAQKVELIHTLWNFMESFVDGAFGIHPVQQCLAEARRDDSNSKPLRIDSGKRSYSNPFNRSAAGDGGRKT